MKYLITLLLLAALVTVHAQTISYDSLQTILHNQKQVKFCDTTDHNEYGGTDYDASNAVRAMIKAKLKTIKIKDAYKGRTWSFVIGGKINCKGEVRLDFRNIDKYPTTDEAEMDYVLSAIPLLRNISYSKATVDVNFTTIDIALRNGQIYFQ